MKTKVIAVNMSTECIKEPRCSFCYQKDLKYKPKEGYWLGLASIISSKVHEWKKQEDVEKVVVALEYSGYNLDVLLEHEWYFTGSYRNEKAITEITMTTMPQAVTETLCGAVAKWGCKAISLSYDSEKVRDSFDWIEKAELIKNAGMLVGCNYLMEEIPFTIPEGVLNHADQINLLSMKPTGKLPIKALEYVVKYVGELRSKGHEVVVDNCLGVQMGLISECKRGKDFVHLLPNGEFKDCCFEDNCWLFNHSGGFEF